MFQFFINLLNLNYIKLKNNSTNAKIFNYIYFIKNYLYCNRKSYINYKLTKMTSIK